MTGCSYPERLHSTQGIYLCFYSEKIFGSKNLILFQEILQYTQEAKQLF